MTEKQTKQPTNGTVRTPTYPTPQQPQPGLRQRSNRSPAPSPRSATFDDVNSK